MSVCRKILNYCQSVCQSKLLGKVAPETTRHLSNCAGLDTQMSTNYGEKLRQNIP